MRRLANRSLRGLLISIMLLLIGVTGAHAQDDVYSVIVPLDPQNPDSLNTAYSDALTKVLVRVTGSADEQEMAVLAQAFPRPADYVLSYRPAADNMLQVSFNGEAIEQVLRAGRHTIWEADRPITLVWLAVDWGQGEREVVAADAEQDAAGSSRSIDRNRQLRERVEETARYRGVPVVFPLLDTEDLQSLNFSDIWGGFDDRILEASRRYGANSILVGRVRADSSQANRWTYYFGEDRLTWSGQPEEVTNLLADELVSHLGIQGDAVLETFTLTIEGVRSVVAYGEVQQLMDNLSAVENSTLRQVKGEELEFQVSVYGGIDRLNKALELSGVLEPRFMVEDTGQGAQPLSDPNQLIFQYRP